MCQNHEGKEKTGNHTPIGCSPLFQSLESRLLLSGTHYIVDSLLDVVADDGVVTLREAIEAANTNSSMTADVQPGSPDETDLITFADSLFTDGPVTITLTGTELSITDSLDILGPGQDPLAIDADGLSRVFNIAGYQNSVTLSGITITGGSTTEYGGGIYGNSMIELINVKVLNNAADNRGGGIYYLNSNQLILNNSTVFGNTASGDNSRGGGIYIDDGTLVAINSVVSGNSVVSYGGGVFTNTGKVILTNSTVAGNFVSSDYSNGGGICNSDGSIFLNNSIVALNNSKGRGEEIRGDFTSQNSLVNVDPDFIRNPSPGSDQQWGTEDDDYGDLSLSDTSMAIDLGNDALAVNHDGGPLSTDIDGNLRIANNRVDIGAYEFQGEVSLMKETPSTLVTTLEDVVDGGDGLISLREAIVYTTIEDQPITFADELGGGTIILNGSELLIDHSTIIDASSVGHITIDAGGLSRVISIHNEEVLVTQLTITGGQTPEYGGAIFNSQGMLTLTGCTISGNTAGRSGGAINNNSGVVTLIDCFVSGNSAIYGGGISNHNGQLKLSNCTVSDNSSEGDGGGINNGYGSVIISGSIVTDNTSERSGGGIYNNHSGIMTLDCSVVSDNSGISGGGIFNSDGMLTLINSSVVNNSAKGNGGGLYNRNKLTITDSIISGNLTDNSGGGIYSSSAELTIANSIISENTANGDGGGIYNTFTKLTMTDSSVTGNAANESGGGLFIDSGTISLDFSIISDNIAATENGGGIYNDDGLITIASSTVSDNSTSGSGGGICNHETLTLIGSTVSGNSADSYGGGIYNEFGLLTLANSILTDNSAVAGGAIYNRSAQTALAGSLISGNLSDGNGGGIFNYRGLITLVNTVILANTTNNYGGGIYNRSEGTLTLTNTTVTGNSADNKNGGGIYNSRGSLTLNNSIVALNHASLNNDIHGNYTVNRSLVNIDPGFVRKPSDGGDGWIDLPETLDIDESSNNDFGDLRLATSSLAINFGDNALSVDIDGTALNVDILGNSRIVDDLVDAGAYEYQDLPSPLHENPSTVVTTLTDVVNTTDNLISLREAIFYSQVLQQDVAFAPELSQGSITLDTTQLYIGHSLVIDATSVNGVNIDAGNLNRVIYIAGGEVTLKYLSITGGHAHNGGGIFNFSSTLTLDNVSVSQNSAADCGGAIYNDSGSLTLINSTVADNMADTCGGGIYNNSGSLTLFDSMIENNMAYTQGGGIYAHDGTIILNNTTVADNSAEYGGGIHNDNAMMTLVNSVVAHNSATYGGGIINFDVITLVSSKVFGNSAQYGGGIYNQRSMTIENSMVFGNTATYGGGINNQKFLILNSSTVSANFAVSGSGILQYYPGTLTLNNSIVALNQGFSDSDIQGSYSNNNSLISMDPGFVRNPSDGGDGWLDNPNTPDIDESVNNDYGDYRLQPTSPAINAGDNTLLPTDEFDIDNDGDIFEVLPYDIADQARISGGIVDIGANEFQLLPGDTNFDNIVDMIDLVTLSENYNQTGDWSKGDFNGDSRVDLLDLVTLGEQYNSIPMTQNDTAVSSRQSSATPLQLAFAAWPVQHQSSDTMATPSSWLSDFNDSEIEQASLFSTTSP